VLDRSIGKLGLSIVGGADHVSRVFGQGKPGLYVSKVSRWIWKHSHVYLVKNTIFVRVCVCSCILCMCV